MKHIKISTTQVWSQHNLQLIEKNNIFVVELELVNFESFTEPQNDHHPLLWVIIVSLRSTWEKIWAIRKSRKSKKGPILESEICSEFALAYIVYGVCFLFPKENFWRKHTVSPVQNDFLFTEHFTHHQRVALPMA